MNIAMCDGSGRFHTFDGDIRLLAFMASIAGAENEGDVQ